MSIEERGQESMPKRLLTRYLLCWGMLLLSLVLFPLIAWSSFETRWLPEPVLQLLFFWPQYLFLPYGLTYDTPLGGSLFDRGLVYGAAAFWGVALGGYVWTTRGLRAAVVLAVFFPVVYVVLQLGFGGLALFDLGVVLSGP